MIKEVNCRRRKHHTRREDIGEFCSVINRRTNSSPLLSAVLVNQLSKTVPLVCNNVYRFPREKDNTQSEPGAKTQRIVKKCPHQSSSEGNRPEHP